MKTINCEASSVVRSLIIDKRRALIRKIETSNPVSISKKAYPAVAEVTPMKIILDCTNNTSASRKLKKKKNNCQRLAPV